MAQVGLGLALCACACAVCRAGVHIYRVCVFGNVWVTPVQCALDKHTRVYARRERYDLIVSVSINSVHAHAWWIILDALWRSIMKWRAWCLVLGGMNEETLHWTCSRVDWLSQMVYFSGTWSVEVLSIEHRAVVLTILISTSWFIIHTLLVVSLFIYIVSLLRT